MPVTPVCDRSDSVVEAAAVNLDVGERGRRRNDVPHPLPTGAPVIVVTRQVPGGWPREDSTVSFETGGIEAAMQRA
jgi:hypothetical protein